MGATTAHARRSVASRIRQALGPYVDRLAKALGQSSYHIRRSEYVATVHLPIEDLEDHLRAGGLTWAPFSLYHRTPMGTSTDGSWTYRPSPLADRQLHVVLFAQSADRVDVYAHEEYNWLRHPVKHARRRDIRREAGSEQLRRWLDAQALAYDHESIVRRKAVHLVELLRERLSSHAKPGR